MSDKPVKVCPKCKARKVEKLISQTSFRLKGGGWYSDLYASQKQATSTSASEAGGEKSGGGGGDKSPSTAPTAESKSKEKGKKGAAKAAA